MRVLFLAGMYDNGVRSLVQERYKDRVCFPFRNSATFSGLFSFTVPTGVILFSFTVPTGVILFSFTVPTGVIFSVRRKSGSSQLVNKLSAVL